MGMGNGNRRGMGQGMGRRRGRPRTGPRPLRHQHLHRQGQAADGQGEGGPQGYGPTGDPRRGRASSISRRRWPLRKEPSAEALTNQKVPPRTSRSTSRLLRPDQQGRRRPELPAASRKGGRPWRIETSSSELDRSPSGDGLRGLTMSVSSRPFEDRDRTCRLRDAEGDGGGRGRDRGGGFVAQSQGSWGTASSSLAWGRGSGPRFRTTPSPRDDE